MSGGGNWEYQMYDDTPENSYVRDNTLFIKPTYMTDRSGVDDSFLSSYQHGCHNHFFDYWIHEKWALFPACI